MFNVQVDENVVKELCVEEIQKKVKEYDAELAFWDTKELKKRVCMSWNTIQDQFFFDHGSQNLKWVRNGISQQNKYKHF